MLSPIIRPTIRVDQAGDGHFGASRGERSHDGIDLVCRPDQIIRSPISGEITRVVYSYRDDLSFQGIEIKNKICIVHLLYVKPFESFIGERVKQGTIIGHTQDITLRYPNQGMIPHTHFRIYANPEHFIDLDE